MAKAWEVYGIDPDEVWGALYDAAVSAGESPEEAARSAREGTEQIKGVEHVDWRLYRIDGGE